MKIVKIKRIIVNATGIIIRTGSVFNNKGVFFVYKDMQISIIKVL